VAADKLLIKPAPGARPALPHIIPKAHTKRPVPDESHAARQQLGWQPPRQTNARRHKARIALDPHEALPAGIGWDTGSLRHELEGRGLVSGEREREEPARGTYPVAGHKVG